MIQANQLRIGNRLVNAVTGRVVIVLEVLTTRILIHVDPELRVTKTYTAPLSSYSGIEFTPAIFEKCGFEREDKKSGSIGSNGFSVFTKYPLTYNTSHGWWIRGMQAEYQIKYLHQLQNLYYALTNEELEINL